MAIYRFEAKIISRSDRAGGRSVVSAASYRAGEKLKDAKYETSHDYSRRAAGVVFSEVVAPENAPAWAWDREKLWNAVEAKEDTQNRHASAQLAREFIIALPKELTAEQRETLVRGFVRSELVSRGMVADLSIHEPKEGDNYHAHILTTLREIGPEGFGKKERAWNERAVLVDLREAWELHCNEALEKAGREEKVSSRSLADRGIEREAQPKLGVAAAAMEKKGIKTERGQAVLHARYKNTVAYAIRDVVRKGQVTEFGQFDGMTWWERLLDHTVDTAGVVIGRAVALLKDESGIAGGWVDRENTRRGERENDGPELEPG